MIDREVQEPIAVGAAGVRKIRVSLQQRGQRFLALRFDGIESQLERLERRVYLQRFDARHELRPIATAMLACEHELRIGWRDCGCLDLLIARRGVGWMEFADQPYGIALAGRKHAAQAIRAVRST